MTNHLHLVIEVTHVPLWKIMQTLGSGYAKKTNKRLNRSGHLFQGRYKAELIQNDKYLLELCFYIHQNPVKASIVKNMDNYAWSSHHAYCGKPHQGWLTTEHINKLLRKYVKLQENAYLDFMYDRENRYQEPGFIELDKNGVLIVKDSIHDKMRVKKELNLANLPLSHICKVICDSLEIPLDVLDSPSQARKYTLARSVITYFGHYHAQHSIKDISLLFLRQPNSVSKTMHRHLRDIRQDGALRTLLKQLEVKLSISYKDRLVN